MRSALTLGQKGLRSWSAFCRSETALKAVRVASELGAKTGAELIALAVVDPSWVRAADISALARAAKVDDGQALERLVAALSGHLDRCQ